MPDQPPQTQTRKRTPLIQINRHMMAAQITPPNLKGNIREQVKELEVERVLKGTAIARLELHLLARSIATLNLL
jgi:hypothetical protein